MDRRETAASVSARVLVRLAVDWNELSLGPTVRRGDVVWHDRHDVLRQGWPIWPYERIHEWI
jgi:hypothetical protein